MKRVLILLLSILLVTGCGTGKENVSGTEHAVPGIWQTASMVYGDDGSVYPEHYVRFTETEIQYGHMKDGSFAADRSDAVSLFEETAPGIFIIQAQASNGGQYTYRTSESDAGILEYYETWKEEDYPGMYRGGASLMRTDDE